MISPGIPFVFPPHSGPCTPVSGTQYEITVAKDAHNSRAKDVLDYGIIQCTLIRKIQKATEARFTSPIRNRIKVKLLNNIRTVIHSLFQRYGNIMPPKLQQMEENEKNLPTKLMVVLMTYSTQLKTS